MPILIIQWKWLLQPAYTQAAADRLVPPTAQLNYATAYKTNKLNLQRKVWKTGVKDHQILFDSGDVKWKTLGSGEQTLDQ